MPALVRYTVILSILLTALGPVASAQDQSEAKPYAGESQGYASRFGDVLFQLDAFWAGIFNENGMTYRSPGVVPLQEVIATACGPAGPDNFASYCPRDQTIYYSPGAFADHANQFGDFAPVVVIAHEWGHHVQGLAGIVPGPGNGFELQADCLAGAYANEAERQELLDPGDLTEAVNGSAGAGDPTWLSQDAPMSHGINDDRITSFMRGYLEGVPACGLSRPLSVGSMASVPTIPNTLPMPALWSFVPNTLMLNDRTFRSESDGASTLDEIAAGLPNPADARERMIGWGWQENAYRVFTTGPSTANASGTVALGVHRFDSADGAAAALSYLANARRSQLGYASVDVGLYADQTEAMAGQAAGGPELIIYARRGNLLFRATGNPPADVSEALLVPLTGLADNPQAVSPALFAALPAVDSFLPGLELDEEHARSASTNAATFPNPTEAERLFQEWGWRESAARVFIGKTAESTNRVETSVFRFATEQDAAAALPYFLDARASGLGISAIASPPAIADEARAIAGPVVGGQETTVYLRRGRDLFRITAIGAGDTTADVSELLG